MMGWLAREEGWPEGGTIAAWSPGAPRSVRAATTRARGTSRSDERRIDFAAGDVERIVLQVRASSPVIVATLRPPQRAGGAATLPFQVVFSNTGRERSKRAAAAHEPGFRSGA